MTEKKCKYLIGEKEIDRIRDEKFLAAVDQATRREASSFPLASNSKSLSFWQRVEMSLSCGGGGCHLI